MALRYLIVIVAALEAVSSSSVSHVSISHGDSAPISYSINPQGGHAPSPYRPAPVSYSPRPTYSPAPTYAPTTPAPVTYASRTYPPSTTPSYEPPTTKAPIYHPQPAYKPTYKPAYKPKPSYIPQPAYQPYKPAPYHPKPSYHPRPSYGHPHAEVPACADNATTTWCLEDEEYPEYEVKHAIEYHLQKFNDLYADVADLNTELSVDGLQTIYDETYLCPSTTDYIKPLRAQNTDGKWRVIVNNIHLHYKTFTQTARIEECDTAGEDCPLVPVCYESSCLQKSIYHRFLVYDSYDQYFPFAIESFKLPASCSCLLGAFSR